MKRLCIFGIVFSMCLCVPSAWAVDKDDDIRADTSEHIGYDASSTAQSAETEAGHPQEAKEIRAALALHVRHALKGDVDGYMGDFYAPRMRYPKLEREYAKRAMALPGLKLTVRAIEFAMLGEQAATVHTRQMSEYVDASGVRRVDDAIISYRWIKNSGEWKIAFTERRRLTASE